MPTQPASVSEYLAGLPDDRRKALQALRKVIKANLDPKIKEGVQYGMIGYFVPHSVYPDGYHCDPKQPLPFLSLASQKNHMALYLFCLYTDPKEVERFGAAWKKAGKRLDMGKSCVRFKKLEDVPLEVLGTTVKRATVAKFLAAYEGTLAASGGKGRKKSAKKATKKATKKTAAKKGTKKAKKKGTA